MVKLGSKPQIVKLARDLRIAPGDDAARAIIAFCLRSIRRITRAHPCQTLEELLATAATRLETSFREIHSDAELQALKEEMLSRGELGFARLEQELPPKVLAITFKLLNPRPWDRGYVSVIDCRDGKAARAYFSKWHELAHLLTQTEQMRLVFRRTHGTEIDFVDPEEVLMEQIAGAVGFLPELIQTSIQGPLSFDEIERLRNALCPTASQQAACIGIVKAWPKPCLFLEARIALRRQEERLRKSQSRFSFHVVPEGDLRAVMTVSNDEAVATGLHIHQNMRVPLGSIIARVFREGLTNGEAVENLSAWESSDGRVLPDLKVQVQAVRVWDDLIRAVMLPL